MVALIWAWVATLLQALRYYNTCYLLTVGTLHHRSGGLFLRRDQRIVLDRLDSLELTQGFWARLLGYGHLACHFQGGAIIAIPHLPRPDQWLQAIERTRGGQ